jgi:hypothetical protein
MNISSDRDPNSKEIENVLLIEIKRTITENDPYNPKSKSSSEKRYFSFCLNPKICN